MPSTATNAAGQNSYTNYVAYLDPHIPNQPRVGHLHLSTSTIQPLTFLSGSPLENLYQVIHIGDSNIVPSGPTIPLSSITLLPPIYGRDILCVGKNYFEHAIEFNSSGYDSSDTVDQPTHPVIFTKRSTSIIASGEEILVHERFTETPDYEGEIGVILGRGGMGIKEDEAMEYVWGYTIINDMTARERQRDHKQFFIGKSPDTFCPMGPIAVPAHALPKILEIETKVNGERRQKGNTNDLIFSVAKLIATISEGMTMRAGDVIATGTPAGVGFGQKPPVFLKPGDLIEISVTGLGTLSNKMTSSSSPNPRLAKEQQEDSIPISNSHKCPGGANLTSIHGKKLFYHQTGHPSPSSHQPILFLHGLGSSSSYFLPLISLLDLEESSHPLHLLDLEGHGLSPTSAASVISIPSYAADIKALLTRSADISGAGAIIIIAQGMGGVIARSLAAQNPELVSKLILLDLPTTKETSRDALLTRAETVRRSGMLAVIDSVINASLSPASRMENPVAVAAVTLSLLGQDPEGYAKGCVALAGGANNKGEEKEKEIGIEVLEVGMGEWCVFEDARGVAGKVRGLL